MGHQWQPPDCMLKVCMKGMCVYAVIRVEYDVTFNLVKGWSDTKRVSPAPGSLPPNSLLQCMWYGPTISLMTDLATAKLQGKLIQLDDISEN